MQIIYIGYSHTIYQSIYRLRIWHKIIDNVVNLFQRKEVCVSVKSIISYWCLCIAIYCLFSISEPNMFSLTVHGIGLNHCWEPNFQKRVWYQHRPYQVSSGMHPSSQWGHHSVHNYYNYRSGYIRICCFGVLWSIFKTKVHSSWGK